MAESKKKENPAEDFEPADNTGQQNNDPETESTQAEKWIDGYQASPLAGDKQNAESNEKVNCLSYWEQQKVNAIKVCRLQNVHQVHNEYLSIKNCVSAVLSNHSQQLDKNVGELVSKNEEMQANLQVALQSLKDVKTSLGKVRDLACKLDVACNDSCHSDQLDALSALPTKDGVKGITRFNAEVDNILAQATSLNSNGDTLFESGIKFAGIQAFINVKSLKPQSEKLLKDATILAEDVDQNMEDLAGKTASCQEEYQAGVAEITSRLFQHNDSQLQSRALEDLDLELTDLDQFECTEDKFTELRTGLEEICEKVENTFNQTVKCEEGNSSKFKSNN